MNTLQLTIKTISMNKRNWTLKDVPDLTGKTIIVTGANTGLGYESVKVFAQNGANVVMACRSVEKGETARKQLVRLFPSSIIQVMHLDLADLQSIHNFAATFRESHAHLDVLLNNAAVKMVPYSQTKDGFESQMGINHLGHFALTGVLLDVLKKSPKSRVVNVSSLSHKQGTLDFGNLTFENGKDFTPMKAYGRSKLANLLFTYELQRFFDSKGIDCMAVAAHPGISKTNNSNGDESNLLMKVYKLSVSYIIQQANMGAMPEIRASVDPDVQPGNYYGPGGVLELSGHPVLVQPKRAALDVESAYKLWEASERLTAITYK
ncbi:MAG: oxidoreductase [Paludibacter sp.]|nr:oxidoreductase [Paludibacter sp.]